MKKRFCLIGIIVTLIVAGVALASCSNLIEDLKWKIPADFVKINGGTYDGTAALTPTSEVFKVGRRVEISDFYICNHVVTQAEYQAVIGTNPSYFLNNPVAGETQENRPVERVSWYAALVYCNKRSIAEGISPCYMIGGKTNPDEWGEIPTTSNSTWNDAVCNFAANGYRLPTEAEWEYCARSENCYNYKYSGSNTVGDVAWYTGNSGSKTHEVKKKLPNALGLYDMSGNVHEWCWDWHGTIENDTPSVGVSSSNRRVARGGTWLYSAAMNSVNYRDKYQPYFAGNGTGLRLVLTAN